MLVDAASLPDTISIHEESHHCPTTGAVHLTITSERRHPACYGLYVGHPISGIRVSRILDMQQEVQDLLTKANTGNAQRVTAFFPMRTTHLRPEDTGANDYGGCKALFANTRHFTLQNRMDALCNADAVLLNFGLRDDEGEFRLSRGIPFDWGWARACGKPFVAVIERDNPNWTEGLAQAAALVTSNLAEGVQAINAMLPHASRARSWCPAVEVFDFSGCAASLDFIARLAGADARKHVSGGRAIITVMPEGQVNASFHGQVREVSDWMVNSMSEASEVARRLLGG